MCCASLNLSFSVLSPDIATATNVLTTSLALPESLALEKTLNFNAAIETFLAEKRPHLEFKRRSKPEGVATMVAFLCSQQASFIVESNYRVDGGSVAAV